MFSSHLQSLEIKAKFQGSKAMVRHWHLVSQLRYLPVRMTWSHIRVPDLSVCQFQQPLPASCSHRHWAAGDGPNGGVCASHMENLDGALNSLQATSISENSPSSCLDETRETEEKASLLIILTFQLVVLQPLDISKVTSMYYGERGNNRSNNATTACKKVRPLPRCSGHPHVRYSTILHTAYTRTFLYNCRVCCWCFVFNLCCLLISLNLLLPGQKPKATVLLFPGTLFIKAKSGF